MTEELKMFEKVTEGRPAEYGYGPPWVSMAMWLDDFPKFFLPEEAIDYWNNTLKKREAEDEKRKEAEYQYEDYESLCDYSGDGQSGGDYGPEVDGPESETERS